MFKLDFLAIAVLALATASTGLGQEFARDIIPTRVVFGNEVGGMVEYSIEYSVLTSMTDGEHITSVQVLINDVPYETIPLTIDPYDGGRGRTGACWTGTGSCASRSCAGGQTCVDCTIICSCNLLSGVSGLVAPVTSGDVLTVIMDPDDLVPENPDCDTLEDNNTLSVVYTSTIPTVSEWGLIVMAVLVLTAGTVVVGRRRRAA